MTRSLYYRRGPQIELESVLEQLASNVNKEVRHLFRGTLSFRSTHKIKSIANGAVKKKPSRKRKSLMIHGRVSTLKATNHC